MVYCQTMYIIHIAWSSLIILTRAWLSPLHHVITVSIEPYHSCISISVSYIKTAVRSECHKGRSVKACWVIIIAVLIRNTDCLS